MASARFVAAGRYVAAQWYEEVGAVREPGLVRGARYVRRSLVRDWFMIRTGLWAGTIPVIAESGGDALQHIGASGPAGGGHGFSQDPVAARQLSRRDCAQYRVDILRLYPSRRIDSDSGSEKNDPLLLGIRRTRQRDGGLSENGTLYRSSLLSG